MKTLLFSKLNKANLLLANLIFCAKQRAKKKEAAFQWHNSGDNLYSLE